MLENQLLFFWIKKNYVYYCNFDTSNYKEIKSGNYKEYMHEQRK